MTIDRQLDSMSLPTEMRLARAADEFWRHPQERCRIYARLHAAFPTNRNYLLRYSESLLLVGDYERAIEILEATTPDSSTLNLTGQAKWHLCRRSEAIADWRRALESSGDANEGSSGALDEARRYLRISQVEWIVHHLPGVAVHFHPLCQKKVKDMRSLAKDLSRLRIRQIQMVGRPFCQETNVFLYPDTPTGESVVGRAWMNLANTERGEIHSVVDMDSVALMMLFAVDGRWPKHHPFIFNALRLNPTALGFMEGYALQSLMEAYIMEGPLYGIPDLLLLDDDERVWFEARCALEILREWFGWERIVQWMSHPSLAASFEEVFCISFEEWERALLAQFSGSASIPAVIVRCGADDRRRIEQTVGRLEQALRHGTVPDVGGLFGPAADARAAARDFSVDPAFRRLAQLHIAAAAMPDPGRFSCEVLIGPRTKPWGVYRLYMIEGNTGLVIDDWSLDTIRREPWQLRTETGFGGNGMMANAGRSGWADPTAASIERLVRSIIKARNNSERPGDLRDTADTRHVASDVTDARRVVGDAEQGQKPVGVTVGGDSGPHAVGGSCSDSHIMIRVCDSRRCGPAAPPLVGIPNTEYVVLSEDRDELEMIVSASHQGVDAAQIVATARGADATQAVDTAQGVDPSQDADAADVQQNLSGAHVRSHEQVRSNQHVQSDRCARSRLRGIWLDVDEGSIPLADESVDVLILSEQLASLLGPRKTLAEARRVLSRDGLAIYLGEEIRRSPDSQIDPMEVVSTSIQRWSDRVSRELNAVDPQPVAAGTPVHTSGVYLFEVLEEVGGGGYFDVLQSTKPQHEAAPDGTTRLAHHSREGGWPTEGDRSREGGWGPHRPHVRHVITSGPHRCSGGIGHQVLDEAGARQELDRS